MTSHFDIDKNDEIVKITHTAPRKWAQVLLPSIWLCGWLVAELTVISILSSKMLGVITGSDSYTDVLGVIGLIGLILFLLIWLGFWTYFGRIVLQSVLWSYKGVEVIEVLKAKLIITTHYGPWEITKAYDMESVENIRIIPEPKKTIFRNSNDGNQPMEIIAGKLLFDYKKKEIKFGVGLNPEAATELCQFLN